MVKPDTAVWDRIPQSIRDESRAAWRVYGQTPSPAAYDRARRMDQELDKAMRVAANELQREAKRAKARKVRG